MSWHGGPSRRAGRDTCSAWPEATSEDRSCRRATAARSASRGQLARIVDPAGPPRRSPHDRPAEESTRRRKERLDAPHPEREPIAPQLVYGSPGVEELREQAIMLGRRKLARRTGEDKSRFQRFLEGSDTSDETLSLVAKAVQMSARGCTNPGCNRSARPRSPTCSEACKKALVRASSVEET